MWSPRTIKIGIVLVASVSVVVLAAVLSLLLWPSGGKEKVTTVDAAYISELHMRLDPSDIPELKEIVERNPNNYTRERAVFVMADIAIENNVPEDVIGFLKGIAYNEKDDAVRSAAYASLDLIREYYPLETRGDLTVSVEGEISEGNTVTLVATASSTVDVTEATVGVKRIAQYGAEPAADVRLLNSPNPVRLPLEAGESREARFTLDLGREGKYQIVCALKLSFDRVDYQTIEKEVYLTVGKTEGAFEVAPEETEAEPEETP